MKTFEEMNSNERLDWAYGMIVLGIGENQLRARLWNIINMVAQDAYKVGVEYGTEAQKEKRRSKRKKGTK